MLPVIISCLLLMTSAYAQERGKPINSNNEDLDWWVNDATNPNNEALLLKAIWFDDQNPRVSDRLEVYCNGITFQAHSSIMGTGPSGFTILSPQQITSIKQIISGLKPPGILEKTGQKHTAVILLTGAKHVRYDYWGPSPPDFVSKIKGIVESGITFGREVNPKLPWATEELRSCVADSVRNIDLETLSKYELLKLAFRRYLYPSERYKILKIYLGRFPDDTGEMTNMLRRWVAAYEKAQK